MLANTPGRTWVYVPNSVHTSEVVRDVVKEAKGLYGAAGLISNGSKKDE
jgi:hypothetical protein